MITVNVGEIRTYSKLNSMRFTPTYLQGATIHVRSPRKEWTKIEWKVINMRDDAAHIIAVAYAGDRKDFRFSFNLNMSTGKILRYSYHPIGAVYTEENAFDFGPAQLIYDKGHDDGFKYIVNLAWYFKRINDLELERAEARLKQKEMLRQLSSMDSDIETLPLAGEQKDKSKGDGTSDISDDSVFFDPNSSVRVNTSSAADKRKYEGRKEEWQVRTHIRKYVRKDGTVHEVEIPSYCCKRKKKS